MHAYYMIYLFSDQEYVLNCLYALLTISTTVYGVAILRFCEML